MQDVQVIARIQTKYRSLEPEMDERMRRQFAAAEARDVGWGGITAVAQATGMSRTTITAGLRELMLPKGERAREASRIRRPGGGRKLVTEIDPGLLAALEALIQPTTRGDPELPLRWTCKSTEKVGGRVDATEPSGPCAHRGQVVARGGLQPAREPEDTGRIVAPGSQRSVRIHQRHRAAIHQTRPARSLGGREKERKGRGFQERRTGVVSPGRARRCACLRLPDQVAGKGDTVRRVRPAPEPGVGERRYRPRHGAVCRQQHSSLVERNGRAAISACQRVVDHGRWRRQQQQSFAALESVVARLG